MRLLLCAILIGTVCTTVLATEPFISVEDASPRRLHFNVNSELKAGRNPWQSRNDTFGYDTSPIVAVRRNELSPHNKNRLWQYVDAYGRERFFHGVNVVVKLWPYHPDHTVPKFTPMSFNDIDMQLMADLGLNLVRLGVQWAGAEPVRGQYNETYFDVIRQIVDRAQQFGIYVMLDMHQDVLSEMVCGEGVPDWAYVPRNQWGSFPYPVLRAPFKLTPSGRASEEDCAKVHWPDLHLSRAVSSAYQALYDDHIGLATSFANFWGHVAERFWDSHNVIGYNLINEPWSGDVYRNPALFIPGVADRFNLQPFYDRIAEAIRKVDPNKIIFFEPTTTDNIWMGFTKVPGGKTYSDRSSVSYHWYARNKGGPNIFKLETAIALIHRDVKRLQCASILTEFGNDYEYQMHIADATQTSWVLWQYKFYSRLTGDWSRVFDFNNAIMSQFGVSGSRPYPHAVAGETIKYGTTEDERTFTLQYRVDKKIKAPTIVAVNTRYHFFTGVRLTISPQNSVAVEDADGNSLSLPACGTFFESSVHELPQIYPERGDRVGGLLLLRFRATDQIDHGDVVEIVIEDCAKSA